MDPTVPSPESSLIDVPPAPPTPGIGSTPLATPLASNPMPGSIPTPVSAPTPPTVPTPDAPPPPDMNNVTGMPGPSDQKVNSKLILWVVLGIVLLLLIGGGAYLMASGKLSGLGKTPTPTPVLQAVPTPIPTPVETGTEGWTTFSKEGVGFTFMYPPDLEYEEFEDGSYSVSKFGPTQTEDTEFFDGISVNFRVGDLEGKTLSALVEEKANKLKEVFEVSTPEISQIAGESGYKMHVKGIVEADYYYVAIGTTSYLEIIDSTKDPTSAGFAAIVEKILTSVKLI